MWWKNQVSNSAFISRYRAMVLLLTTLCCLPGNRKNGYEWHHPFARLHRRTEGDNITGCQNQSCLPALWVAGRCISSFTFLFYLNYLCYSRHIIQFGIPDSPMIYASIKFRFKLFQWSTFLLFAERRGARLAAYSSQTPLTKWFQHSISSPITPDSWNTL